MTKPDDHDPLSRRLARLPRELPPSRDLWPEISERVGASRPRHRVARLAAASGLAMAAAAALVLGLRTGPRSIPGYPSTASAPERGAPSALAGESDFRVAEVALATELEARRAHMSADEVAVLDDNLRVVDEAIQTTRSAIGESPGDPELRAELDRAWEDKLDLLQQATELPEEK
jgi:hypothetical protein